MTAAQAHLFEGVSGLLITGRKFMLYFLMCLFGLHSATEVYYTVDDEEI